MAAKATLAAHGYETTPVVPHTQTAQQYTPVVHSPHTSHSVTHYPNTAAHSFPVTHSFPIAHAPRTLTYNATPTHKISHQKRTSHSAAATPQVYYSNPNALALSALKKLTASTTQN